MPYIDPIELLQLAVPSNGDIAADDIRRAKRKLLAEFELSGKITIRYRGSEIDKSTALQAAEALEDPTLRAHHVRLHRHRELQEFLRAPQARLLARIPAGEKLGDAAYIKFIGERLAPIYIDMLGTQVRRRDWVAAGLLLNRLDLLDSWQHEEVLKPFISHIRLCHRQLTEVNESTPATWKGLWDEQLIDVRMMEAMNRLPRTFQEQRNQYARLLANVAIHMNDPIHQITLAHMVILAAAKLEVDHSTQDRVNKVQAWIWSQLVAFRKSTSAVDEAAANVSNTVKEAQARANASGKSGRKGGSVFLWLAVIITTISLSLRFCGKRSESNFDALRYMPSTNYGLHNDSAWAKSLEQSRMRLESLSAEMAKMHILDSSDYGADEGDTPEMHQDGGSSKTRIDTIFFRDLIFYETLNEVSKLSVGQGTLLDVKNGSTPYTGILPPPRAPWDKKDTPESLRLVNRSTHGVVFFFESLSGGQVLYNYYVGPGSSYLLSKLPTAFYMVRAYHGLDLRQDCGRYLGNSFPAFTREAGKVDTKQDSDARDLPGVTMLYHSEAFNFGDQPDPPKELIFNAKFALEEK